MGNNKAVMKRPHICIMQKADTNVHQIYLYDDISEYGSFNWNTWEYEESETSAKAIRDQMEAIPADAEIELFINSNGGSIKEGTAIFNMLKRHPAQKTGYVDGAAHSVAFVIFQACDKRVMGAGTSALVHDAWVGMAGNARELRAMADQLDAIMESNRKLFLSRATISEEKLIELMANETMLTPEQALEYGLCDAIGGLDTNPPVPSGIQQGVNELRKKLMEANNMDGVLEEFKEHCGTVKETPEDESPNLMAAFFDTFL